VLDGNGRLLGIVTPEDLRALALEPLLDHLVLASDVAHGAASALSASDSLARAMRRLIEQRLDALPVIDGDRRPIAVISRRMLLDHYQGTLERIRSDQQADGYEVPESTQRTHAHL